MRRRASFWLAWSLAGVSVAMFAAGFVFALLTLNVADPVKQISAGGIGGLLVFLPFLAFPIVGVLISSKRPENPIGWICLTAGLFWIFTAMGDPVTAYSLARTGSVPGPAMLDALTMWSWALPLGLQGTFMVMLFPDGRLPSRRWRPLAWLSGTAILLVSVALTLEPGPLPHRGGVRNPLGIEGHPWIQAVEVACILLLALCIVASAASLIWRYRHSDREARQQIKWLAFAASFVGLAYSSLLITGIFLAPESLSGETPIWISLIFTTLLISFAGIPTAIGFAVLKYRLYDIDIIINRALVYGSLTVSLAAVYFGGVVGTQAIFRAITGQEQQPQFAIVVSTLAIAALFGPLRRRIQDVIDRRFYRRKYDAALIMAAYGTRLRDEVDLQTLSDDLLGVVRETMQPAHASLWLRSSDRKPAAMDRNL
ncbi:MAG: hypothetical protein H0U55_06640 [Rubrobacteraceae bacterium]|nr:hypothetical protein [Rubrobacteraceae bacterium]